ncbi:MAG: protein phosphatase 2C domain-containing protein [Eubacterium sp.]|nr:protein phosphatase 2C domain-containing protein [Eubacterium sp.]
MLGRKKTRRKKESGIQPDVYLGELCEYADSEVKTEQLTESKAVTQQLPKNKKAPGTSSYRSYIVEAGTASIIGSRKSQQDSVFAYASGAQALGIVCDGMGGLAGGETASRIALESLADAWFAVGTIPDIPAFFRSEAVSADQKVYSQKDAHGARMQAGTTMVAAIVQQGGLYWLSVGDSKLYFIRGQEILSLNVEHNYRMELNALLRQGRLTAQEYAAEEYRAEALTSYLGIGDISVMDVSPRAYPLTDGDIILLASDGLYRSLHEEEILAIVQKNSQDMQKAAQALTAAVSGRKKQDNTSVVIMRYTMEKLR